MNKHIPYNLPLKLGTEKTYLEKLLQGQKFSGDGLYTKGCTTLLTKLVQTPKCLMTASCTQALEMAAILSNVGLGDEVILPAFTHSSTANAFVLRRARLVFVDIDPATMNIDPAKVRAAITPRTKAIVAVHYAGVACDMEALQAIAQEHQLFLIEDAAHGIGAKYKDTALGNLSDFGAMSFHESKNIHCGEGGALFIKNKKYFDLAEIIREKGTNRMQFLQGEVKSYSWVEQGSSFLPPELAMAFLLAQLEAVEDVTQKRLMLWHTYFDRLQDLQHKEKITLPFVPDYAQHNGHVFYIKCRDVEERKKLIAFMKKNHVSTVFHYVPLHSSRAGRKYGKFHGKDQFTTSESEKLLRLPLYYQLEKNEVEKVVELLYRFYS